MLNQLLKSYHKILLELQTLITFQKALKLTIEMEEELRLKSLQAAWQDL